MGGNEALPGSQSVIVTAPPVRLSSPRPTIEDVPAADAERNRAKPRPAHFLVDSFHSCVSGARYGGTGER